MKKTKLLAAVFAISTAVLLFLYLSSRSSSQGGNTGGALEGALVPVYIAAVNIPENTVITEEMLVLKNYPEEVLVVGSTSQKELIVGKGAGTEILAGEQILERKLISSGDVGSNKLAYALTAGMRAITIAVDSTTGLSGMLKPRDKVDLIASIEYKETDYTTLVAENITVLAVNNYLTETELEAATIADASYSTITLEVTPSQALEISMASSISPLRAVLRSPLDENINNINKITLEKIMAN